MCLQFVTQLQFLSSFSKLLQSCVTVSPDLIGQMETLKQLLNALVAVLTLDAQSLGLNLCVDLSHKLYCSTACMSEKYISKTVVALRAGRQVLLLLICSESRPLSKFEFQLSRHCGSCLPSVWCHKIGDSLFPPPDAGTRDAVCGCWTDLFTLLATVVRRDGSAAYPSVSAALGRRWRTFTGMPTFSFVCVQGTELIAGLYDAYNWHLHFHNKHFNGFVWVLVKTLVKLLLRTVSHLHWWPDRRPQQLMLY